MQSAAVVWRAAGHFASAGTQVTITSHMAASSSSAAQLSIAQICGGIKDLFSHSCLPSSTEQTVEPLTQQQLQEHQQQLQTAVDGWMRSRDEPLTLYVTKMKANSADKVVEKAHVNRLSEEDAFFVCGYQLLAQRLASSTFSTVKVRKLPVWLSTCDKQTQDVALALIWLYGPKSAAGVPPFLRADCVISLGDPLDYDVPKHKISEMHRFVRETGKFESVQVVGGPLVPQLGGGNYQVPPVWPIAVPEGPLLVPQVNGGHVPKTGGNYQLPAWERASVELQNPCRTCTFQQVPRVIVVLKLQGGGSFVDTFVQQPVWPRIYDWIHLKLASWAGFSLKFERSDPDITPALLPHDLNFDEGCVRTLLYWQSGVTDVQWQIRAEPVGPPLVPVGLPLASLPCSTSPGAWSAELHSPWQLESLQRSSGRGIGHASQPAGGGMPAYISIQIAEAVADKQKTTSIHVECEDEEETAAARAAMKSNNHSLST